MRHRLWHNLRYDWPLHFVLWLLNGLPDNVAFLRLRGWAARPFFGRCDGDLRLGRNLDIYNPGKIEIGKHVYIAFGCVLLAAEAIIIEDEVMFGPYVVTVAGNHTKENGSFRYGKPVEKPIKIGFGSWIGSHVTIAAGADIGQGCLVAANSIVVAGPTPINSMLAGNPAKVIKEIA